MIILRDQSQNIKNDEYMQQPNQRVQFQKQSNLRENISFHANGKDSNKANNGQVPTRFL